MDPRLWDLLHDASLAEANGAVPGDLSLKVEIEYLRDRFPGKGVGCAITLRGCSQFLFEPYQEPPITDLTAIAAQDLWILGAEAGDPMPINCATGTLLVRYTSVEIELDSGGDISLAELEDASRSYWREWSERHQAAP